MQGYCHLLGPIVIYYSLKTRILLAKVPYGRFKVRATRRDLLDNVPE